MEYSVKFSKQNSWTIKFKILRNEQVILIDENFDMHNIETFWNINLAKNFYPDSLIFREEKGFNKQMIWKINENPIWTLEPWTHWWKNSRHGPCFGLFKMNDILEEKAGLSDKNVPIIFIATPIKPNIPKLKRKVNNEVFPALPV